MLLRNVIKKSKVLSNSSARTMSIQHRNSLKDPKTEEYFKKGTEKYAQRYDESRISEADTTPIRVSHKDIEEMNNDPSRFTQNESDHAKYYKPGDEKRTQFYSQISEIEEGDHEVIQKVKNKIRKLLDEEVKFLSFKNKLEQAQKENLIDETYGEIVDVMAPGNIHRKIPYVLPHEHIHPQHHISTEDLSQDEITKLYAYYSMYVDFHISQIRRSVDDKSYIPPQFNQISSTDTNVTENRIDNKFIEFYHRWREPTRTWRSQTQEIDNEAEWAALPENHHPDPRAFHKHEVEWSEDQKFPHVANRKGYPIMMETPLERMFGLEYAPAHPSFQFQAFVQTPSMDPDPTLNFEKGETIYENKRVGEWVRMWKWILTGTLPFWPAFYTFEIYQADGAPSLQWLSDSGSWFNVPTQMQDSGDWNLYDARYCDEHDYMNIQYIWKRTMIRPSHTMYQLALLYFLQGMNFDYVTKMVYNKDKDLVYVYKPHGWFTTKEYVHEVHHLESMVPATVNAYQHLGMGHKDGITTLNDMDTKEELKIYNDPKYWNIELRDEFIGQTRTMWPELSDQFDGRVVHRYRKGTDRDAMNSERIQRELDEAVEKHGRPTPAVPYTTQFYDDIRAKRKEISEGVAA